MTTPRIRLFIVLLGVVPLGWLPLLAGCGHESAASPGAIVEPAAPAKLNQDAESPTSILASPENATATTEPVATEAPSPAESVAAAPAEPPPASDPPPTAQRPRADRTPQRPGDAEKITFEDLNLQMPVDVVFREFMLSDRVKDLEGKRVSIAGWMHGGQEAQRGVKKFILLKNTQCKFGPGGQADHLADVWLRDGTTTSFTPHDIRVEGTFRIAPFQGPTDGNTWSIYRLEDAQIR